MPHNGYRPFGTDAVREAFPDFRYTALADGMAGGDPEFRRKRIVDVGLEPVFDTPGAFAVYLKEDRERAGRIAQAAGLVPQ